jgi:hypothetical protein
MILPPALALSFHLITVASTAGRVPQLDVEPVCKGIAEQGGVTFQDPAVPQEKKNCIESEQAVREQLVRQWSGFSAGDRTHCINETTMGGESSYTELLTCLEMARDVRAMRAEAAAGSRAALPPPATPTGQPAEGGLSGEAAKSASTSFASTSAEGRPNFELDSMRKELDRAKADARNAVASELSAQRKLADAEAALRRTAEEAEQAKIEALQAKAEAQAAKESVTEEKHRLAGAEKARPAAEGQCEGAAKEQPGLGAQLRKWFGGE